MIASKRASKLADSHKQTVAENDVIMDAGICRLIPETKSPMIERISKGRGEAACQDASAACDFYKALEEWRSLAREY